jgi:hypothetical protein
MFRDVWCVRFDPPVTAGPTTSDYALSGGILSVFWSPGGTALVTVSSSDTNGSDYEVTLITP